jgi:hypothetical protein
MVQNFETRLLKRYR